MKHSRPRIWTKCRFCTYGLTEWPSHDAVLRLLSIAICSLGIAMGQLAQARQAAFLQIQADTFPQSLSNYRNIQPFQDTATVREELEETYQQLREEGFLLANIDTSYWSSDTLKATLHVGKVWGWASIEADSSAQEAWEELNLGKSWARQAAGASLDHRLARQALVRAVEYYENRGYPFAEARWQTALASPQQLHGKLHVQKGVYVVFDTLRIQGDASVDNRFLRRYLGLDSGRPFSQKALDRAEGQLQQLPYLQLQEDIRAAFALDQAYPILQLKAAPSNKLNGVVGILFDPQRQSRPVLTGDLNIALSNPFRRGREIGLKYRRLKEASQRFELSYKQPALLGTRFDIAAPLPTFLGACNLATACLLGVVYYWKPRSLTAV